MVEIDTVVVCFVLIILLCIAKSKIVNYAIALSCIYYAYNNAMCASAAIVLGILLSPGIIAVLCTLIILAVVTVRAFATILFDICRQ